MNRILANRIIFVLALVGLYVSLRLTISHLTAVELPCGSSGGCGEVDRSVWASGFGIPLLKTIPTAAFGLLLFAALAVLSFMRATTASEPMADALGRILWILALLSVLVSAFLIYLQGYVIHAWCPWCLASEAILFLIFLTATAERFRASRIASQGEIPT